MVKVKDFCGAVFHPQEYQNHLKNNIQHLEDIPMSKTFRTADMIAQGKLHLESSPCVYIYCQHYKNHTSYGIVAEISIEDYHNKKIKKHQKTLHRPDLNHHSYTLQHVGPVVVSHRENAQIDSLILSLTKTNPKYSEWTTNDGRIHSLWKIKENEALISSKFELIDSLYILDGHHRLQAAHKNYLLKAEKTEVDLWIQAIIYSSTYIMIHPQHRAIQNIPENIEMVNQLMKLNSIEVTELAVLDFKGFSVNEELYNYEVILKLYGKLYGINFKNSSRNILQRITTFRLQNEIFKKCFDDDLIKKLKYVPGIIDQEHIFKYEIVFFVKEPQIETLFQLADSEVSMPPKSTWIQPKPCSHMVIRLLN